MIPSEYISALQPSIIAVWLISPFLPNFSFLSSGAIKKGVPVYVSSSIFESVSGRLVDSPKSNNFI